MPTPLELDLAEALERIEAILNKRPGACRQEEPYIQDIRALINAALKQLVAAADQARGFRRQVTH